MRRPSSNKDQSVSSKWADLREYEAQLEQQDLSPDLPEQIVEDQRNKGKFQVFKEKSSKHISDIKNHLRIFKRKSENKMDRYKTGAGPGAGEMETNGEICTSPQGGGKEETGGCTPLQSVGAKIRGSKSLQNLEQATKDGFRQMVDKTQNVGTNMKQRYGGSRLDMTAQSRCGKYDKMADDHDSDEENFHPGGL